MSRKDRVLESSVSHLLGTAARIVASNLSTTSPCIETEILSEIISNACDAGIIHGKDVRNGISNRVALLENLNIQKHIQDEGEIGVVECLSLAFQIVIAAKIVAAKTLISRARKSKRFNSHVRSAVDGASASPIGRLCAALRDNRVKEALRESGYQDDIERIIRIIAEKPSQSLMQVHVGHIDIDAAAFVSPAKIIKRAKVSTTIEAKECDQGSNEDHRIKPKEAVEKLDEFELLAAKFR